MKYLICLLFCFIVGIAYAQPTYKTTINVGTGGVVPGSNCCCDTSLIQILVLEDTFTVTNSTTLVDITGLSTSLEAGSTYYFESILNVYREEDGGFPSEANGSKIALSGSVIPDMLHYFTARGFLNIDWSSVGMQIALDVMTQQVDGTGIIIYTLYGKIRAGSSGTLDVQFAQADLSGGAISSHVLPASYLLISKIK